MTKGKDDAAATTFADRLKRAFEMARPTDPDAAATLDRINEIDRRIASVRQEVKRGVRRTTGRFRL